MRWMERKDWPSCPGRAKRNPDPGYFLKQPGSRVCVAALRAAPRPGQENRDYIDTLDLKPPQIIRLVSNGIFFGSMPANRLSFITAFMQRSRTARDG
jgi:hypothetical protein